MNLKFASEISLVTLFISLVLSGGVYAAVSNYTASSFSQYCASNPSFCKKVEATGKKAGLKCPDFNNQLVSKVYVHAGDGQTVYELPHTGFNFIINQNGIGSAAVEVTTHPHNLSWVAVVCSPKNSPTPTPTNSCTPTVTVSPTSTPTPTPSQSQEVEPSPTVSVTVTPTPTITETPTPTPTQSDNSNGGGGSTLSSSDSGRGGAEVLGTNTLAFTGSINREGEMVIFFGGLSVLLQGLKIVLRKKI